MTTTMMMMKKKKKKEVEKKKKKEEEVMSAMDNVQPGDSISNIDSFSNFSRRW